MKLARRVPSILLAFAASGALVAAAPPVRAQPRGGTGVRVAAGARSEPVAAAAAARVAPASPPTAVPAPVEPATPRPAGPQPADAARQTSAPRPPPSPLNPTPAEMPPPAAGSVPDIEALMTRATALRSRIAALGATLFSSKLRIELRAASESARVRRLHVSLDGGVVYSAPAQAAFEQPQLVYEHAVAAGPHVIAVEIERQDQSRPEYSTWQSSRFVVVVPERQLLWTRLDLEGESTMGEQFAEEQAGRYELGVRLDAEVGE